MRTIVLFLILFGCGSSHITAQNDYLVTTISNQEGPLSEEEQFIKRTSHCNFYVNGHPE